MKKVVGLIACVMLAGLSCQQREALTQSPAEQAVAPTTTTPPGVIHAIELPRYQVDLPPSSGRETFAVACLSCHSPRYISMQPPLSEAKWDEEVRKMIKTYGAPITEDQVPIIVQYLMATKERGPPDAWDGFSGVVADVPTPPDIKMPTDFATRTSDMRRGAALYATNCASCHGATGAGDGSSASSLMPPPTDLRQRHYSATALTAALWNGVPGTAMPGYRSLPANDLRALATFTQSLGPAQASVRVAPDSLQQAQALYAENCAACHGQNGAGDGFAAPALARRPTNFQSIQPTSEAATKVIAQGIPGSSMSQWRAKFNEAQQRLLADYVRSMYKGNASR